ncbi:hypothetical protein AtEden1_Chr3g0200901 [Arabidopsis thaliana]
MVTSSQVMLMPAHDSAKSTGFGIMVTSLDLLRDHQKFIHTLWFIDDVVARDLGGFDGFCRRELVLLLFVDSTNTTLSFTRNDMTCVPRQGGADSDHWLFKRHLALLLPLSFAQVYEGFISFYEEEDKHISWDIKRCSSSSHQ